ncbi:MAG: hypothetical protein U0V48_08835 [Anaerolineales bacterium]
MGEPKENYSRWYNASPYFFLDRINAPVQLICGGTTHAVPRPIQLTHVINLFHWVKDVELLLYEDEVRVLEDSECVGCGDEESGVLGKKFRISNFGG